jgi:hypothetical protein
MILDLPLRSGYPHCQSAVLQTTVTPVTLTRLLRPQGVEQCRCHLSTDYPNSERCDQAHQGHDPEKSATARAEATVHQSLHWYSLPKTEPTLVS